jgi:hypothetical protein
MKPYKNLNGDSGVTHYEIGEDYIGIKFAGKPTVYLYSNAKVGKTHIDKMKTLAVKGRGLGTYISQHSIVKNNYEKRGE